MSDVNTVHRRLAIRNGEESVVCSTALLRSWFISADFSAIYCARSIEATENHAKFVIFPRHRADSMPNS
jgi:hypothetical protein